MLFWRAGFSQERLETKKWFYYNCKFYLKHLKIPVQVRFESWPRHINAEFCTSISASGVRKRLQAFWNQSLKFFLNAYEKNTKYVRRLSLFVTAIQFINSVVHTYTQWTWQSERTHRYENVKTQVNCFN